MRTTSGLFFKYSLLNIIFLIKKYIFLFYNYMHNYNKKLLFVNITHKILIYIQANQTLDLFFLRTE